MTPSTAREALIVEAIGDAAKLLDRIASMAPVLDESCRALLQAGIRLRADMADFERRMAATAEFTKSEVVKHIAARTAEAARQSIDQQSRAMADAARVAFGAELGATMQRLQTTLRPLLERHERRWERWLTHTAVATVASAATWTLVLHIGAR